MNLDNCLTDIKEWKKLTANKGQWAGRTMLKPPEDFGDTLPARGDELRWISGKSPGTLRVFPSINSCIKQLSVTLGAHIFENYSASLEFMLIWTLCFSLIESKSYFLFRAIIESKSNQNQNQRCSPWLKKHWDLLRLENKQYYFLSKSPALKNVLQ